MHHFPHDVVTNPDTGMPAPGAIGRILDASGNPIAMYDASGAPISQIVADVNGMYPDIPVDDTVWGGWVNFGSGIENYAWVVEAPDAIKQVLGAVDIANSAASDASAAVALASSANATAAQMQVTADPLLADSGITQAQLDAV